MRTRLLIVAVALLGCGSSTPPADMNAPGCTVTLSADGADVYTRVQTALIEARAGSTICFRDGTYRFSRELSLSVPRVTLKGLGDAVVFDFAGQRGGDGGTGGSGANSMSVTASGFTIERMTLKNSPGDGIRVTGASDVVFRRLNVSWDAGSVTSNGAYAIYPVGCTRVIVEDCEVSGASDAGIYVGQSRSVIVRRNRVHGNVAGIEIENTTDSDVYENRAWDNTAGVLVFNLPNLPVRDGRRCLVRNNTIEDNNRANFAPRGTIVASVPVGIGVLVMAADETEVRGNTIRRNNGTGVGVVNYRLVFRDPMDANYNVFPEGTLVRDNMFSDNGSAPMGEPLSLLNAPVEDIIWDGAVDPARSADSAARTCVTGNGTARWRNLSINDVASSNTDLTRVNCTLPALPELTSFAADGGV
jgi:parallel beta-helix repeat protein